MTDKLVSYNCQMTWGGGGWGGRAHSSNTRVSRWFQGLIGDPKFWYEQDSAKYLYGQQREVKAIWSLKLEIQQTKTLQTACQHNNVEN